jgi:hypothetical protein
MRGGTVSVRYVGKIGEAQVTGTASSVTFTANQQLPVGTLVVLAMRGNFTNVVSSVSDSAGNTWSKLANTTTANTCNVWYSVLTTAITTSTTVTANFSASGGLQIMAGWAFHGFTRPSTSNAIATGSSVTTLSPASLSVPQYGSLVFSAMSVNQLPTFTEPAGFTALPVTSSSVSLRGAYLIRNGMNAVSTTWSWSISGNAGVVSGSFTPDGGDLFAVF